MSTTPKTLNKINKGANYAPDTIACPARIYSTNLSTFKKSKEDKVQIKIYKSECRKSKFLTSLKFQF